MDGVANSIPEAETSSDLRAIINDVSTLKRDLATLVRNMKTDVAENVAAQGQRSVKAIGQQVEEQPIISLLLAFAVGFIGSRMLSR